MSTATLTSLAILKTYLNQHKDYLDYLIPFVQEILRDASLEVITGQVVKDSILRRFGLEIPERTVQIVLKRLAKRGFIKLEHGAYHVTNKLPNPQIAEKKNKVESHIDAVVSGLLEFSKTQTKSLSRDSDAVTAILAFLSRFDISCLQAYLRETAIPDLNNDDHNSDIVLVSEYVLHLQKTDVCRFESFQVMVQGHMLANALLCPDLENVKSNFAKVIFYFDTPLLVQQFGLEGQAKKKRADELIALLRELKGEIAIFAHTRREFESVIRWAAEHIDSNDAPRGEIITEARRRGTNKSDLLLRAEKIDDELAGAKIIIKETPEYSENEKYQISETEFEDILEDSISYYNPLARQHDINSVRSIYVLRKNRPPNSLEQCKAILVTSNSKFSEAAWNYCKKNDDSCKVSTVITDFALANIAWLKAPMGAPMLPVAEVIAFAYAALEPPRRLLEKFLSEVDKLEEEGEINEKDLQLLRGSPYVYPELMNLTLGSEYRLTEETVGETLRRVYNEIKKEESGKTRKEEKAHQQTKQDLDSVSEQHQKLRQSLYWECSRGAERWSNLLGGTIGTLILLGTLSPLLNSSNFILQYVIPWGSGVTMLVGVMNIFVGTTLKELHQRVRSILLRWFLQRKSKKLEIGFSDLFGSDD